MRANWQVISAGLTFCAALAGEATASPLGDRIARHPDGRCLRPGPERPYVCDVGEARPMSLRSFNEVLSTNSAVRDVVQRLGYPDRAELQRISVDDPWLGWEIRTYYFSLDRMMVFGRAFVLDRPEISKLRHIGRIPQDRWNQLVVRDQPWDQLADAAAERAERSAAVADEAALRGEDAASRASAVGDVLASDFHQTLIKK